MAARGTLLLRTIVRRFEPRPLAPTKTATTHPTLQTTPPCATLGWRSPSAALLFSKSTDSSPFFECVWRDSFHEGAGYKTHGRAKRIQGEGNGRGISSSLDVREGRRGRWVGELEFVRCSESSSRVSGCGKARCYPHDSLIVGFGLYRKYLLVFIVYTGQWNFCLGVWPIRNYAYFFHRI